MGYNISIRKDTSLGLCYKVYDKKINRYPIFSRETLIEVYDAIEVDVPFSVGEGYFVKDKFIVDKISRYLIDLNNFKYQKDTPKIYCRIFSHKEATIQIVKMNEDYTDFVYCRDEETSAEGFVRMDTEIFAKVVFLKKGEQQCAAYTSTV